ncbi:MAG: cbb3-type cytochrome c oxidase subunit I, partial [Terriglobales bacterium]
MSYKKLWIALAVVVLASFAVLGGVGYKAIHTGPPIPAKVATTDGRVLFTGSEISDGQNVWQAMGGQEVGTIWGHGAYVAPDWSADWLHRESVFILDRWAQQSGATNYQALGVEQQAALQARLQKLMRTNTYDTATDTIVVDPIRAEAFEANAAYYADVFMNGRKDYAIQKNAINDPAKMRKMAAFFFWTSWAASTQRPGADVTYTQNWPHEPLVGNNPTPSEIVWSIISFVLLLAGVGALVWYQAAHQGQPIHEIGATRDPLLGLNPTPSQRATIKYFFVVAALWVVQILMGVITAHYGVEGGGFYGIPLDRWLPYAVTRTWHLQIGIFWIATAWVATGLYIAPAVSGAEPKHQRLGVNALFGALLLVVTGSLFGEWASVQHKLGNLNSFWFGTQGYEYVDLGRFWQILLFVGLCFWLFLVYRGLKPALQRKDEFRPLLMLFTLSAIAIPLVYAAGLMYGQR